ncbi:hypothetical protein AMJ87_00275 [candidate division WOR_3 bacterium SM23_60]|uniref:Uncharacterized protein n=1 Tax=candidate division WOR_3 bacterium SM23_60 TaxID=1703780 RepID=A0A0S8GNQ8_UNCW3|nr:MAG: hypothetical protein AMJ87_00275 [candidate division WOR_3 bacterium SM23_60]
MKDMSMFVYCDGTVPVFDAFHAVRKTGRVGENVHIMEYRIRKPIADRTCIFDYNWNIALTRANDPGHIILVVLKILQSMKCFPVIFLLIDYCKVIGL